MIEPTTENKFLFATTLYNLDTKGKVRQWSISVIEHPDATATITVAQGLHEGKLTERDTHITKGKNVGRANETTPVEQAVSEAESKVRKQLDKGYQYEIPKPETAGRNGLGLVKPMLALSLEKAKGLSLEDYVVQPKFDGFRMLALKGEEDWFLYTRQAKPISVPHIEQHLKKLDLPVGTTLDGELYCHDLTFQQISSAAKKPNENTSKLAYHIYDLIAADGHELLSYHDRYETLVGYVYKVGFPILGVPCKALLPVKSTDEADLAWSEEDLMRNWDAMHMEWLKQGYEGSIARSRSDTYKPNGRDKRMLKRKDFHDEEFKITGIDRSPKPAPVVGSAEDYPAGSVNSEGYACQAQFICETADGAEFLATMEGGVLARAKLWASDDSDFIDKLATVKYFEMTDDGIPRHPIARRRLEL